MAAQNRSLFILGLSAAIAAIIGCSSSSGGPLIPQANQAASGNGSGASSNGGNGVIPNAGGNNGIFTNGGAAGNPCLTDNPPANCELVASGPACGDGAINQESEACDDANSLPGDGCNGICKVEPNYTCPTAGKPCVSVFKCGNGKVEPGEVCDDGNTNADDGCNADCTKQSASYRCLTPGQPCEQVEKCGDKRIGGEETCDDGNTTAGDGCDAKCTRENGWLCQVPGQPCNRVRVCGDGIQAVDLDEACDDGNTKSGDGCSADCKAVEAGFQCPEPGKPCSGGNRCGDGKLADTEACDDGNTDAADGCDQCQIQKGFDCPFPGAKCIGKCGDGLLVVPERCDDGNTKDGDGCSSICQREKGWSCTGNPGSYSCHKTTCGDANGEGTEGCDDGNSDMGDGCTPLCQVEPNCKSGACKSNCGDAIVLASMGEACDDGNRTNGDGCTADCKIESGFECKQPALGDAMAVPVVYRDFNAGGDFQPGVLGSNNPTPGMVQATLNDQGKPVYSGSGGNITSAASFANWYKDASGTNSTHVGELKLCNNGSGAYVNRWGANCEQWISTKQEWCGEIGKEVPDAEGNPQPCTFCSWDNPATADIACDQAQSTPCQSNSANLIECVKNGNVWNGVFADKRFDGNPVFFPVDAVPGHLTPTSAYSVAKVPSAYSGNWADEIGKPPHNFHFTSEVRYWFMYEKGQSFTLDFLGDDDVWVFINRKIVLDLGGIHTPINGRVVIGTNGGTTATITPSEGTTTPSNKSIDLGLQDGQVYEIVVFQAERQTEGSSYKLTLSGFNASASVCGPVCGDGVPAPGEQCDDGTNEGGYGKCQPGCIRGAYCGDGKLDADFETCDNGTNSSPYGSTGCAPGCITPPKCGDGKVQSAFNETCDDSVNDGAYGGCTSTCQFAPRCGDGKVNGPAEAGEECDDGANDGTYNHCAPGCKVGPRCGDGIMSPEFGEQCEDGNDKSGDGCSEICRIEGVCGDALVDPATEECDDGLNDGGYGECAPGCKVGQRCGDGVTQPEEACDGGPEPTGGYGECAKGCVLGPHCGDKKVQAGFEECDDGNKTPKDGCSPQCKIETPQLY